MRKNSIIVVVLLLIVSSISSMSFATTDTVEIIKIGLQYTSSDNTETKTPVINKVTTFFEFGERIDDQYIKHFDLNTINEFYYAKDDLYHASIDGFADYQSVYDFKSTHNLSNTFIVKNQAYSLYASGVTSSDAAQATVNEWAQYGLTTSVNSPNNQLVVLVKDQVLLGFDSSTGEYILAPQGGLLEDNYFSFGKTDYRGGIGAKRLNTNDVTLINYVTMNAYLYGVVPREMSKEWPVEALKAQAIVARNFAIVNKNKFSHYGFNLDTTVNSQVYGGLRWEGPISNQAVDETTGLSLLHKADLVNGFYHSNSGGYTENSENVWSSPLPYIKGVYDPFSLGAPNDSWSLNLSNTDIENKLNEKGYGIGTIKNFYVSQLSENQHVLSIVGEGSQGTVELEKQKIRSIFGYNTVKSTLLTIMPNNAVIVSDGLTFKQDSPSNLTVLSGDGKLSKVSNDFVVSNGQDTFTPPVSATAYTIAGKGWGHGLGMSQWGAKQMAEQGFDFEQILTFYYTGTHIE